MTKDEKIAKLGKEITDRATVLLGKDKITPDAPEYLGINSALKFTAVKYDEKMADDILDIALTMKKRVPLTIEQLAKKNPQFDRAYLEKAMQAISESGLVEFHWENLDGKNPNHEKRWVLDMFVPGSAEIMMINPEQADMFPETADFFERMAYLPLAGITEMVPPGGAGIGMHVIPVEKAIPAESKSLPIEHLSHWLKKYEGHIGVSVCSCRKQQRIRGEGSGDVEGEWCIGVGDFADYCRETNHGHDITYEEAMEILQKAEDRGYVHQITNIDGENKIFGICNCAVGVCNALRTSQLFNTPNLSASAYVAESDPEKCVACGKCVETCPAGAVRLGQKLCTKEGPSSIRTMSCRTTPSGARITGTRITATRTDASRPGRPARRPARLPARHTSPSRATSRWRATAAMPTRSSSSRRITRSRLSAVASAESTARMPAPAAPSTSRWPSTRSRSSLPSRT